MAQIEPIDDEIKAAQESKTEARDKIISKLYFDPAGYGSIQTVLRLAKMKDNMITKPMVQE
jgi:hypothetical protein